MKTYEFNLSIEELEKRTNKDYLITKKFLKADAPEYLELKEGDKIAPVSYTHLTLPTSDLV